jgi:parvulin-like peptidyl-prolyl isomerase
VTIGRDLCVLLLLAVVACHSAPAPRAAEPSPTLTNAAPPPPPPQNTDLDSRDILARTEIASPVLVKHVLIGWADLAPAYQGHQDPRGAKRTHADAAKLAEEVAAKLRADPTAIDALMVQHSEDPGSLTKEPYTIETDSPFVPEFKNLGQRLAIGEVGIVATHFGYHVMVRIAPPAPDPLESADILARAAGAGPVEVQHILLGWQGLDPTKDAIAQQRTKAQADTLATELLGKVRGGGDMAVLMKQYSEDPGSNATGKPYTVQTDTPMVEPFKALSLRLNIGEAGLVKTRFGWHIIKRVPPPPPDSLESAAIMKRTTVAEKTKVKHILLGWKAFHAEDPRGASRTRPELEKLVKATLAKLAKKGTSFEAVMADLSEDPGSAKTGEAYDASPTAGLVKPFLDMSLRLNVNEIGVVKTDYGIHIIKRVE